MSWTDLHDACSTGSMNNAMKLIESGAEIEATDIEVKLQNILFDVYF
jgi:hypothetical protein